MSDKLTHAKALAAQGFRIFPLIENGKVPAIQGWPAKATTDLAQIERWWGPDPHTGWTQDLNIGVLTGEGLVVIDVDVKNGAKGAESFAALDMLYEFPETFTVTTPSGGKHVYFRSPIELRNSASKIAEGIDVRGTHGFVVGPGSAVNGATYCVVDDRIGVAEIPTLFQSQAQRSREVADQTKPSRIELDDPNALYRAIEYLNTAEPAIEGAGGDHHTFTVAARLKDFGVSEPTALDLMLEHWNERCSPPWLPEDLKTKITNAYRYGESPPGVASPQMDFEPVNLEQSKALHFELYEDVEADRQSVPLIEDYLEQHAFSVIYGESNTGKTFVALDMAFHIATGRPWNGHATEQGGVVYIAAEGGKGIRKRISALKRHHGVSKAPLAIVPCSINLLGPRADTKSLAALIDQAALRMGCPIALIVIDTLARAMAGGNENASEDMGAFVQAIDKLRAGSNAHVMVVHHSGKDTAKGARGHSSLRAATDTEFEVADNCLHVKKQRDEDYAPARPFGLKVIELGENSRGKPVTSCVVVWPDGGADFVEVALTPDEARCLDAVKAVIEDGLQSVTAQAVSDAYSGLGFPGVGARAVKRWLGNLETKGAIKRFGNTRDTKWMIVA